jgi:hypothetical protein
VKSAKVNKPVASAKRKGALGVTILH